MKNVGGDLRIGQSNNQSECDSSHHKIMKEVVQTHLLNPKNNHFHINFPGSDTSIYSEIMFDWL